MGIHQTDAFIVQRSNFDEFPHFLQAGNRSRRHVFQRGKDGHAVRP